MKNILISVSAFFILHSAFVFGGPIEIPADAGTRLTALEGATNAILAKLVAQADTNVTTTATLYTPRFKGDTLVGGAGTGTNAVWISKGTTTNDWVAIKP